jgi:hypothetical protein
MDSSITFPKIVLQKAPPIQHGCKVFMSKTSSSQSQAPRQISRRHSMLEASEVSLLCNGELQVRTAGMRKQFDSASNKHISTVKFIAASEEHLGLLPCPGTPTCSPRLIGIRRPVGLETLLTLFCDHYVSL